MSTGNTFENDLAKLIFQATAIANIADNAATSPLTNLYMSLHSTDPGEAGDQTTGEITYTGYARVAVARTSGGWTVTNNVITNTAAVPFGLCTAGSANAFFWAVGTASSGSGKVLYSGAIGTITHVYGYTAATSDTLIVPGSSLVVDDRISLQTVEGVSSQPGTGITVGTLYFVKSVSGVDITLSTSSGGATLDVTAAGSGLLMRHSPLAISTNVTPNFAIGQISITLG